MLAVTAPHLCVISLVALQVDGSPRDPTPAELDDALASFSNALPEVQAQISSEILTSIAALPPGAITVARDRAVKELPLTPRPQPVFHDPKEFASAEFARGRVVRVPVEPESVDAAEKRGLFRPEDNQPFYAAHVIWDFGLDQALDWGVAIAPPGQLFNALHGYPPDSDVLVAWLAKKFDFDDKLDAAASYFGHVYCDLNGKAYPEIALYDAWSSGSGMDMPDVDTIAFARTLLHDSSWTSPIPANARRQKLYDTISSRYLDYFKYRSWIESAANLWVNPQAPLRENHEGLRRPLLWLFASERGDVSRIAKRLAGWKTRDKFLDAVVVAIHADPKADTTITEFTAGRAREQWPVTRAAYAVLREHDMLVK